MFLSICWCELVVYKVSIPSKDLGSPYNLASMMNIFHCILIRRHVTNKMKRINECIYVRKKVIKQDIETAKSRKGKDFKALSFPLFLFFTFFSHSTPLPLSLSISNSIFSLQERIKRMNSFIFFFLLFFSFTDWLVPKKALIRKRTYI